MYNNDIISIESAIHLIVENPYTTISINHKLLNTLIRLGFIKILDNDSKLVTAKGIQYLVSKEIENA